MLLAMLTVCRKAEVTGSKWSEIDLKAAEWEIPADRMKAGRAQRVPLCLQCVKLLQELRALVPDSSVCLFPDRIDPDRPMADRR